MKNITKSKAFLIGFFVANTLAIYSFLSLSSCAHQGSTKSAVSLLPVAHAEGAAASVKSAVDAEDPQVMSQIRQLTFVGTRSGEGYFSADGKKMVFQSEREAGNPFYQIYLMDLVSGETQRISTGQGKTTCSWIDPSMSKVLFSSTHQDKDLKKKAAEEYEQRKAPQKGKYSWSFDEEFEIYERDLKTQKLKALTHAKGYDAEASYSPDGKYIAFASNRAGYTEKLSAEEQKLFAQDPSYMMDIYIMKADGTEVRQLTTARGYDGGPFFSADGKKITWRRFAVNGQSAEIHSMNIDGSDEKALTHLKAMSWAPFFHPSGDYVIFTTNKMGFANFELYIVDAAGTKDPVRVSYVPDFDGLPAFSPDGTQLTWTHRNEKGESQIYISQWDDQKARTLLGLGSPKVDLKLSQLDSTIRAQDIRAVVEYMASPELAGRKTGSPEEKAYSDKLADLFAKMGLEKVAGSNIAPFEFTHQVELGTENELFVESEKTPPSLVPQLVVGKDFIPLSFSKTGRFMKAPLSFAGYGIMAAASEKDPAFDSYKNVDVKGKWVLIFRDIPENIPNTQRIHLNLFSRFQHKVLVAKQKGAVGVLIVAGPNSGSQQKLMKLKFEGAMSESSLPVVSITNELAETLLAPTGRTLKQWQDVLDNGELQGTDVPKVQIQALLDLKWLKSQGHNVVGKISVKGATETLVIGAHGDHLGRGEFGSSLAKNNEQGQIHFGADDNASGVAGVIELAHYFATAHKAGKIKLRQNLVFAVWSGEEIGLLGSSHWIKNQKTEKVSAYINMDMIGRYRERLMVQGVGSAKEWKGIFEQLAAKTDLDLTLQEDPYLPSDSMAFYMEKIPGVMFFTGAHPEYHSPRDVPGLINYTGEEKILNLVSNLISKLASIPANSGAAPIKLSYLKAESSRTPLQGRSFRVYLGTIPDYAQEGVKGVKISGTSKDSPAEKAGLRPGDVIVELASLKVENLYDYVYGLQSLKAGQPTAIKVQRSGNVEQLSITPALKE
jgi:Tol biopolymer transport system component